MAYVYRHIRLDKKEPFYIGVGTDAKYRRAFQKTNRNIHWNRIVSSSDYEVEILIDGIDTSEAFKKEKEFIKLYGCSGNGTGCLSNQTDGGEGSFGRVMSAERRKQVGDFFRGKKRPDARERLAGANNHNYGKPLPEDVKEKIRMSLTGRKSSKETREKQSAKRMGVRISEQSKIKIGIANKGNRSNTGRFFSEDHKRKISEAHKRFHANKRIN